MNTVPDLVAFNYPDTTVIGEAKGSAYAPEQAFLRYPNIADATGDEITRFLTLNLTPYMNQ